MKIVVPMGTNFILYFDDVIQSVDSQPSDLTSLPPLIYTVHMLTPLSKIS